MRYLFQITKNGKKVWCAKLPRSKRKIFPHRSDAVRFIVISQELNQTNREFVSSLSNQELEDVRNALKIKPNHLSLLDCVRAMIPSANIVEMSIKGAIDEFIALKKLRGLTPQYIRTLSTRLSALSKFPSFANIKAQAYIKTLAHLAPKTQKEYIGAAKELLDWAVSRNYIVENPFLRLHSVDLPKQVKAQSEFATVEQITLFFDKAIKYAPNAVSAFALVAFAGLRASEAFKLKPEDIDYAEKTIKIKASISKTGDNWLQQDLPANVWAWLEKYPPNWSKVKNHGDLYFQVNKGIGLPHNALRHSFATYHLSLYRNATKTSLLLKHRNPSMLWQHYLGGLTSKAVAEQYFNIQPYEKIE